MSLHLLHCRPDPAKLAAWATRRGLLAPDGDYGYALHALLTAAFGAQAPKPFCYLGANRGLLAYTDLGAALLREHAQLAAPDVANALGLDSLETRPFPTAWRTGQRLGFEVRVRPVVRAQDGRERDAYLHALDSCPVADPPVQRETVYCQWLSRQLQADAAARVVHAGMDGFRLARVLRASGSDGKRKLRGVVGPSALFKGELLVTDGPAFARLVARGVGRHRSFGFGMLLLRPVRIC